MESKVIDERLLGEALKSELKKGFDILRLSHWALKIESNNLRALTPYSRKVLIILLSMEDDPQFEYSEDELWLLADMLINGEEDPLKKIDDRYQNKLKEE